VLALLAPLIGGGFYFVYRRNAVRREVKHMMKTKASKDDLVEFNFTKAEIENELKWKHSKEFEYKGVMYDIIEVNENGDLTQYWCWKDEKETHLNKQLIHLTNYALGHDLPFKNQKQQLKTFVKSLFAENWTQFQCQLFGKNNNNYAHYSEGVITPFFTPPCPPPKFT